MSFDLQAFKSVPSQELLNYVQKSDLLDIAAQYELTTVNKFMLKQEIKIFWSNFEIHTQLTVEQSSSYDTVKELILKAYELVPEAYMQKLRNIKKMSRPM